MITHSRETYQPTSIMRWDRGIFNGSDDLDVVQTSVFHFTVSEAQNICQSPIFLEKKSWLASIQSPIFLGKINENHGASIQSSIFPRENPPTPHFLLCFGCPFPGHR